MKKMVSFVITLALILSVNATMTFAAPNESKPYDSYITVEEASDTLVSYLQEEKVAINPTTRIGIEAITDTKSGITGSAIVAITMIDDYIVQKDYLLLVDNEGIAKTIHQRALTSSSEGWTFSSDPNGYISIHVTTVDNIYSGYYYQPQRASFYYSKLKTCTVSWMQIIYTCRGVVYSYPGFVSTGTVGYHAIYITRSNPSPDLTKPSQTCHPIRCWKAGWCRYNMVIMKIGGTDNGNTKGYGPEKNLYIPDRRSAGSSSERRHFFC